MKRKIALYTLYSSGDGDANEVSSWIEEDEDYTRVSEVVEVEFEPRDAGDIVVEQVKSINSRIEKIRVEAEVKVTTLEDRRNKLLAIEHQPAVTA